MNVYQALNAAADHMKTHWLSYSFGRVTVPPERGREEGRACAYGWTCHFLNQRSKYSDYWGEHPVLAGYLRFSDRMDLLVKWYEPSWIMSRWTAYRCLRRYAEKYHGDLKSSIRPDSALVADLIQRVTDQTVSIEDTSEELTWA